MFNSALGGATEMNAKQTQRKQANAKRKALDMARNFVLDFVLEELDDEVELGDAGACIDMSDLAHKALTALENAHPQFKDMHLFMQVEKWAEVEVHSIMLERGYSFDYPITLLSFSLVE